METIKAQLPTTMRRILCQVLSNPGKVVSFSELNKRGFFKKPIEQFNGKKVMEHVANEMANLQLLGDIQRLTVAENSCQVNTYLPL